VQLLVRDVLRSAARRHPDRIAVGIDDLTMTFGEVDRAARLLAGRLVAAGVGHGDRVGWVARNSLDGAVVHAACAYLGAVYTPFNPGSTPAELAALVEVGKPAVVLGVDGRAGTTTLESLPDAGPLQALPDVSEADVMVLFFTSGTTGRPKGAMLSNRVERLRGGFDVHPRGAHVSMFPQFHMAGWVSHLESWMRGDPVIWCDRAEPEQLFAAIERHAAHGTYLIPAVWRRVLDADRSGWDLSSLRVADTGTSVTSPELLLGIKDAFPRTHTSVVYGSTEAHRVCVLHDPDLFAKPYSVGQPNVGTLARRDETGELWVKSPLLFCGYFENEAATDEVLVDGWYRTGDVVQLDDEGYVSVVGRTKELIRSGGETVAPVEVEAVVRTCRGVADAAVAGMADDTWGEIVTAFVVPRPGVSVTLDGLRAELGDRLTGHKLPRRLVVVDEIPRTGATGQIARARLVALAQEAGAG
jgi:acyl-CoA synthetase (AMP-forming)/AMP-acid ligase II